MEEKTALEKFSELTLLVKSEYKKVLTEVFSNFWYKNPSIKSVVWDQYAPYFNDGEPCLFSVNPPVYTNAQGEDLDEEHKEGIWYFSGGYSRSYLEADLNRKGIEGLDLDSLYEVEELFNLEETENMFKNMFGDDVKVVATREGFAISDYSGEHD